MFTAVEIEINHACNRSCSYCPNSVAERKSRGRIDPAVYSGLLRELEAIGFSGRLSYDFYNEPLLHPQLTELVSEARMRLPRASIELYTNGTLLTREKLDALVASGVSRFVITRQEEDADSPDYAFERTWNALSPELRARVLYRTHRELSLTNRGGKLPHIGGASALQNAPCFIPSMVLTVTVSGNVLPCFEDFDEIQVMGNLRDQSLMDIWHSEKYTRWRAELGLGLRARHEPCRGCSRTEALPRERALHV